MTKQRLQTLVAKLSAQFGKERTMSKIGRKPIDVKGIQVTVSGQTIQFKGPKASGSHELAQGFSAVVENDTIRLTPSNKDGSRETNVLWGMHRALLANKLAGAVKPFEKQLQITGLGFKAAQMGKKLEFTLGYTHKLSVDVPETVTVEIDKTGQMLTFRSSDRELLGAICDRVRSFRPPEPYKGTGIKLTTETIIRKAGKAKAAA
jgi:large subunit ribosomal protein L6